MFLLEWTGGCHVSLEEHQVQKGLKEHGWTSLRLDIVPSFQRPRKAQLRPKPGHQSQSTGGGVFGDFFGFVVFQPTLWWFLPSPHIPSLPVPGPLHGRWDVPGPRGRCDGEHRDHGSLASWQADTTKTRETSGARTRLGQDSVRLAMHGSRLMVRFR